MKKIYGFSKLSKDEKIKWVTESFFKQPRIAKNELIKYWNSDKEIQIKHDEFIENTLSNFYMPLGVAPNFIINGSHYTIPMVIEESSVVAAASNSAKYWSSRGGFNSEVINIEKIGHIHVLYSGIPKKLFDFFNLNKKILLKSCDEISSNMSRRGGGIKSIELIDKTHTLEHYFQFEVKFNTVDSMGANFINSCLEEIAASIKNISSKSDLLNQDDLEVIMSILSNYVPNCLVKSWVECPIDNLSENNNLSENDFAKRFDRAVKISEADTYRAVTHNKGIMNGVDSVVLATGNDFRAVEAGIHAYASRTGVYRGLSKSSIKNGIFSLEITLPLSVGTVGGLTNLHPLVKWSLELLKNPNSQELMQIIGVAGLAQNFAAIRSLISSGIQKGHMKMHLLNILNQMNATKDKKIKALKFFKKNTVSYKKVEEFLKSL
tara:strand:- start:631 stop:1932 length:1302 start_codon:yes stop_codon:yes gene_type:complete